MKAHRYGLTCIGPTERLREAGWRQVWEHPSGLLAMRHPNSGRWYVSDGMTIDGAAFCSSLRAVAAKIERLTGIEYQR
jgi:hypothetical protein